MREYILDPNISESLPNPKQKLIGRKGYRGVIGGVSKGQVGGPGDADGRDKRLCPLVSTLINRLHRATYNLKLQRNDPKIEDLNCRPEQEVRFQRWKVHLLEFAGYSSSSTALSDGHKRKEGCQTYESC